MFSSEGKLKFFGSFFNKGTWNEKEVLRTTKCNSSSSWCNSKDRIALDMILFLIARNFLSRNTWNSCKECHLLKSRKDFSHCLTNYTFNLWAYSFTITKSRLLYNLKMNWLFFWWNASLKNDYFCRRRSYQCTHVCVCIYVM